MEEQKKKSLSEISHLFLSSVRENATGGAKPRRIPPGGDRLASRSVEPASPRSAMSIDLTPEEYARVISESETSEPVENPPYGPVSAIICSQFSGHQMDRAKEYARHLAAGGDRVGLIQVDVNECCVICFETAGAEPTSVNESVVATNPRQMSEALEELAWDVDRWLLLLPSPRLPEARGLLRKVDHWVLLSTCDHDGVVSCYRAIKGLAELPRPRLTLALLNAADQVEAGKVYRKVASVCEQFLNWKMEAEPAVEPTDSVIEHVAMSFSPSRDRSEAGVGPQWELVHEFLTRAQAQSAQTPEANPAIEEAESEIEQIEAEVESFRSRPIAEPVTDRIAEPEAEIESAVEFQPKAEPMIKPVIKSTHPAPAETAIDNDSDVADLPGGEVTEAAVLAAVMNKSASGLVQCPIHPPACPQAALAVGRDRRLVLLAVARKGLGELRAIAMAYRWVIENRPLLSMALPQFAIDAHAHPSLKLLVDRADAGADLLLPMAEQGNVTVQTYRKLRWAGKTGLLLEAA
jgi:hypothetical protein